MAEFCAQGLRRLKSRCQLGSVLLCISGSSSSFTQLWHNSLPCGCMTESPVSLPAENQGKLCYSSRRWLHGSFNSAMAEPFFIKSVSGFKFFFSVCRFQFLLGVPHLSHLHLQNPLYCRL